jgi:hypothetical protein
MPIATHPKFMAQPAAVAIKASPDDHDAGTARAVKSSSVLNRIMAFDGFLKPRRSSSSKEEQQRNIVYKGRTRAVFIGINYYGTSAELYGKC